MISLNDTTFASRGLLLGTRLDGREFACARAPTFTFARSENRASSEVLLGGTRVHACVSAEVCPPFEDRPLDGFLVFGVELLGSAGSEGQDAAGVGSGGRPPLAATHIARILERQIRDARAVDTEAMCIVPGECVWSLRCDVRVVEDAGNLVDAASLAAMAALLFFRRPEAAVRGGIVTLYPEWDRAPVPLAVHHIPLTLSYGCVARATLAHATAAAAAAASATAAAAAAASSSSSSSSSASAASPAPPAALEASGELFLRDPTLLEESVCSGSITLCMNAHAELCGVHKLGGCPVSVPDMVALVRSTAAQAPALVAALKAALAEAEQLEQARAKQRHAALFANRAAGVAVQ